jgi:hypothetical protein
VYQENALPLSWAKRFKTYKQRNVHPNQSTKQCFVFSSLLTMNMYIKDLTLSYDKTSKGEVFPAHAMKAYTGSCSIVPLILNLATIWKQVVTFHNPAPLSSPERTSIPTEQEAEWGPELVWTFY